ncbi:MAG: hypothetical protein GY853_03785 [PVC group bacterium]|nr:hypothetical protein [PVC group bacterium]
MKKHINKGLLFVFVCLTIIFLSLPIYAADDLSEEESSLDYDYYTEDETVDMEPIVEGVFRLNLGVENREVIVKDANYSRQEETWRYLFGDDKHNTYDPVIYNQLKLSILAPIEEGFSFYTRINIDPWAFVGTSQTITLPSWYGTTNGNDPVELKLKYWSNNTRTYAQTVRSSTGDTFQLPEIKVVDRTTRISSVYGVYGSGTHRIDIPELGIDREFKPMRAFWFDLKEDECRVRFFLYAEDSMGLYFDDPLRLCGNHINYEPSPWLDKWQTGRLYSVTGWEGGTWQSDFWLRNSEEEFLTLLRGVRIDANTIDYQSSFMIAAPLDPWDDYDTINNVPLALRLKKEISETVTVGTSYASRLGYDKDSFDALYQVAGIDSKIDFFDNYSLSLESAVSKNGRSLNNDEYKAYADDYAYKTVLSSSTKPFELGINSQLSYTYMGREFDSPLSNYTNTRQDQTWGEHIWFTRRSRGEEQYRIGDSIDQDRKVAAFTVNLGPLEGFNYFFNLRNVHNATDNEFIENVFRSEIAYKANEQLLTKFLYIFNKRPKTTDGRERDMHTLSGAFKYDFIKELSFEQIVERTNKYPTFPGELYDWLTINPAPPYPYFYFSKSKLIYTPAKWIDVALEHTYNEFEHATTLDDFMNYSGIDMNLKLSKQISTRCVYRYSRVADYGDSNKVKGHHNFYVDLMYDIDDDSQIGVRFSEIVSDFYGAGWEATVLDTQHIIRLVYKGRF